MRISLELIFVITLQDCQMEAQGKYNFYSIQHETSHESKTVLPGVSGALLSKLLI
jgi:hypothetical protein